MSLAGFKDLVARLFVEMQWATSIESVLETGNTKPLESTFKGSDAGHVMELVHKSLVRELVLTVTRLYDPGSDDILSLYQAFYMLRLPGTRAALIAKEGDRLQVQYGKDPEIQIVDLELQWKRCRTSNKNGLAALRKSRDVYLAHNLR